MSKNFRLKWFSIFMMISGVATCIIALLFPETLSLFYLLSPNMTIEGLTNNGLNSIRFFATLAGTMLTAWGLMGYHISFNYSFESRKVLLIAFVFWFIMDNLISFISGFPYNIILNIGFFAGGIWSLSIPVEN